LEMGSWDQVQREKTKRKRSVNALITSEMTSNEESKGRWEVLGCWESARLDIDRKERREKMERGTRILFLISHNQWGETKRPLTKFESDHHITRTGGAGGGEKELTRKRSLG